MNINKLIDGGVGKWLYRLIFSVNSYEKYTLMVFCCLADGSIHFKDLNISFVLLLAGNHGHRSCV